MSRRWRGGVKPLDAGTGIVCASFASNGAWLSFGARHPSQGFVELSGMPRFDETLRGRPDEVRRYRSLMADESSAFLFVDQRPGSVRQTSAVRAAEGARLIHQELRFRAAVGEATPSSVRLLFRGRLDRPLLAMITEVGARPLPTGARTLLDAHGSSLRVSAPELPARVEIRVAALAGSAAWQVTAQQAVLVLDWPATQRELVVRVACELIEPGADVPGRRVRDLARPVPRGVGGLAGTLVVPVDLRADVQRMRARALRYVRECTALRSAAGRLAILTDHRLLPLSWTRDAYYQALLLLSDGQTELVADHLRWLWLSCERPAHTWARSHHANGQRKDEVYQADQQLYPLLELADYWRATGGLPPLDGTGGTGRTGGTGGTGRTGGTGQSWTAMTAGVVDALVSRMSSDGLLPTDENAADDPAALPYLLANQVLACYTFERVAEMSDVLGLRQPLSELARRLRGAVARQFPLEGSAGALFAYAVDGRGGTLIYHDANDLPTALAPLWGFCTPDDPLWRRTMDFSFSPANEAYASGRYGGLGSGHTPGTWSLGLIQEWVARSLVGRREEAESALRRLLACALSDGSLPEASDPDSARCLARPWFAWPGALFGTLVLSQPPHSP